MFTCNVQTDKGCKLLCYTVKDAALQQLYK